MQPLTTFTFLIDRIEHEAPYCRHEIFSAQPPNQCLVNEYVGNQVQSSSIFSCEIPIVCGA